MNKLITYYMHRKASHLTHVLLLLLTQGKLNEDLLKLLIAVVDDELLEAVVLWDQSGTQ